MFGLRRCPESAPPDHLSPSLRLVCIWPQMVCVCVCVCVCVSGALGLEGLSTQLPLARSPAWTLRTYIWSDGISGTWLHLR